MREIQQGVWWWEAVHPDWEPGDEETQDWGPEVSAYAIDDGERLLLFDPLLLPAPLDELASRREIVIVLTCPWHERDARKVAAQFGATAFVPSPDENVAGPLGAQLFGAGDRLRVGVEALPGMEPNDVMLWVESRQALVAGDTLIDRGSGLEFPTDWANKGVPAEQILETLQPLLELPVKLVLPTHGPPTDRAALERALA